MAYNTLSNEDIVLSSEAVTTPMWAKDSSNVLNSFYSSSAQIMGLSGDYYLDIYGDDPNQNTNVAVEFACTFADKYGRGAAPYGTGGDLAEYTPSRTIFGQYRSLVLGDEESDFYFGGTQGSGSVSSSFFWAINIDRARYKESLMPGTLALTLGSITLVDNSTVQGSTRYIDSGRVYNLVEGDQYGEPDTSRLDRSYGYFLPDIGVLLVDGKALNERGVITDLGFLSGQDMVASINALMSKMTRFALQAKETVTSNYIFIRAKNSEFNYSMNPSNITATGELRHKVMVNSPETYITTIGLYNNNNDLVAVAKLSRPLPKNFTKEALFRIKLDY